MYIAKRIRQYWFCKWGSSDTNYDLTWSRLNKLDKIMMKLPEIIYSFN